VHPVIDRGSALDNIQDARSLEKSSIPITSVNVLQIEVNVSHEYTKHVKHDSSLFYQAMNPLIQRDGAQDVKKYVRDLLDSLNRGLRKADKVH
jgi:hypothetical protein